MRTSRMSQTSRMSRTWSWMRAVWVPCDAGDERQRRPGRYERVAPREDGRDRRTCRSTTRRWASPSPRLSARTTQRGASAGARSRGASSPSFLVSTRSSFPACRAVSTRRLFTSLPSYDLHYDVIAKFLTVKVTEEEREARPPDVRAWSVLRCFNEASEAIGAANQGEIKARDRVPARATAVGRIPNPGERKGLNVIDWSGRRRTPVGRNSPRGRDVVIKFTG